MPQIRGRVRRRVLFSDRPVPALHQLFLPNGPKNGTLSTFGIAHEGTVTISRIRASDSPCGGRDRYRRKVLTATAPREPLRAGKEAEVPDS